MSTNGESRMLVVLEEIRDEVRQTNRRLDVTNRRIDGLIESGGAWHRAVNERLASMDARLESMDARLATLENLFGALVSSVQGYIDRLARLEQQMDRVVRHVGLAQ